MEIETVAALLKAGRGVVLRDESSETKVGDGSEALTFQMAEAFRALYAPAIPQVGVRLGGCGDELCLVAVRFDEWMTEYRVTGAYGLNPESEFHKALTRRAARWREYSTRMQSVSWIFQVPSAVAYETRDVGDNGRVKLFTSGIQWVQPTLVNGWPIVRTLGKFDDVETLSADEFVRLEGFLETSLLFVD